jgi:hypothetical protein
MRYHQIAVVASGHLRKHGRDKCQRSYYKRRARNSPCLLGFSRSNGAGNSFRQSSLYERLGCFLGSDDPSRFSSSRASSNCLATRTKVLLCSLSTRSSGFTPGISTWPFLKSSLV